MGTLSDPDPSFLAYGRLTSELYHQDKHTARKYPYIPVRKLAEIMWDKLWLFIIMLAYGGYPL